MPPWRGERDYRYESASGPPPATGWIDDWRPEDPQFWAHTGRGDGDAAYVAFIAFYLVCLLVTWAAYRRPGHRLEGV